MAKLLSRYLPAMVLLFSAIVVLVIGIASGLSATWVIVVSALLIAIFSVRQSSSDLSSEVRGRIWIILLTGIVFLIGGALGIVRSVHEHWQWTDRLPLIVPLALGLYVVVFAIKMRRRPIV